MGRKSLLVIISAVCIFFTTASAAVSGEAVKEDGVKDISSFGGYEWDTPYEEVLENEITPDMSSYTDYELDEDEDLHMKTIILKGRSVGGYDAVTQFIFSESGLSAAGYALDVIGSEEVADIVGKYAAVYGDALVVKEYSAGKTCAIWEDGKENRIALFLDAEEGEDSDSIIYFSNGSEFWDLYSEHGPINLNKELNKIGNLDGI